MILKSNLILIGFPASGKTTLGKIIAEKMRCPFYDLDELIEKRYQESTGKSQSCREIFKLEGETKFRSWEEETLKELLNFKETFFILASGGGLPLRTENQAVLKKLGSIFYLKVSPTVLFRRLRIKGFPAYLGDSPNLDKLNKVYEEREPIYRACADKIIETEGMRIKEIVEFILKLL